MTPSVSAPIRAAEDHALLDQAIADAIARKPNGYDFIVDRNHARPAVGPTRG